MKSTRQRLHEQSLAAQALGICVKSGHGCLDVGAAVELLQGFLPEGNAVGITFWQGRPQLTLWTPDVGAIGFATVAEMEAIYEDNVLIKHRHLKTPVRS